MKKYNLILAVVLIVLLGYFLNPLLPWWSLALIAFLLAAVLKLNPSKSALAGFLAGLLLWGGVAFLQSTANEGILAERIGAMLGGLPGGAVPLLSGLIGGITASLGALLGSFGRNILSPS